MKKNELQPKNKSQKCKYSIGRHQFEIQENMRAIEDAKSWIRSYCFEIE